MIRPSRRPPAAHGTIGLRLLANALVDPDEAATRLPEGLRPHVIEGKTVVGCCLLSVENIRPAILSPQIGWNLRAAAHRISVAWEDAAGSTITGVYVPVRHTDSRIAVALGGRVFPGVHQPARISLTASPRRLDWTFDPTGRAGDLAIRVAAAVPHDASSGEVRDPTGATCIEATIGISPNHRGVLEAARMEPAHRHAIEVTMERLDSAFIRSFATATPARSYLMRDVGVVWTRAPDAAVGDHRGRSRSWMRSPQDRARPNHPTSPRTARSETR